MVRTKESMRSIPKPTDPSAIRAQYVAARAWNRGDHIDPLAIVPLDTWNVIFMDMGFGKDLSTAAMTCTAWNRIISKSNGIFFKLSQSAGLGPDLDTWHDISWSELFALFVKRKGSSSEDEAPKYRCRGSRKRTITSLWEKGIQNAIFAYQDLIQAPGATDDHETVFENSDFEKALSLGFAPLAKALFDSSTLPGQLGETYDFIQGALLYDTSYLALLDSLPDEAFSSQKARKPVGKKILEQMLRKDPKTWIEDPICLNIARTHADHEGHILQHYLDQPKPQKAVEALWNAGFRVKNGYACHSTEARASVLWIAEKGIVPKMIPKFWEFYAQVVETLDKVLPREELVKHIWTQSTSSLALGVEWEQYLFKKGFLSFEVHGPEYLTRIKLTETHLFKQQNTDKTWTLSNIATMCKFLLSSKVKPVTPLQEQWLSAGLDLNGAFTVPTTKETTTLFGFLITKPLSLYGGNSWPNFWEQQKIDLNPPLVDGLSAGAHMIALYNQRSSVELLDEIIGLHRAGASWEATKKCLMAKDQTWPAVLDALLR